MEATTMPSAEQIEREIGELLDQEIFEPPAALSEKALITDESVHEEAARDPEAWWAKQAEALLDWFEPWDEVLDESDASFYKWFVGGRLNASHDCHRPSCRRPEASPACPPRARRCAAPGLTSACIAPTAAPVPAS